MLSFWTFFLRRRQFSILVVLVLILVGGYSMLAIPKESAPEVEVPVGIVSTTLRGGSAADLERLVTNKLEDEISTIDNLDKVTSSSQEGVSIVTAQFLAEADLDKSIQDLKDAVDRAKTELPREADDPSVIRINFADQPILILSLSVDQPRSSLVTLGNDLQDALKDVEGVSRVDLSGVEDRETTVVVRKEALQQYGLTLQEVIAALSSNNATLPIGSITVDNIEYAVKFEGDITSPDELPNIPAVVREGVPVYLRDIAFISDGVKKISNYSRVSVGREAPQQAISLFVYKRSGGDVTAVTAAVREKLEKLKTTLLDKDTQVVISFDQGELVKKDLTELTRVGLETVALVMIALLLTIGWRESVVAGLSIPLSFLIAFIGLYASGNTINFVSLFSLIMAIGILVDSGIVVTEAIQARVKKYGTPFNAAIAALTEYAWPLIGGTFASIAVFVPLFFISGVTGKFIASIPFTVIFVLLASIFVALGIVPLIAVMFTKTTTNRFEKIQEHYTLVVQEKYKKFLASVLSRRRFQNWFIASMVILFVASIALPVTGALKVIFFPGGDSDFIYVEIEKPQGTTLLVTDTAVRVVEQVLRNKEYVESFVTTVGGSSSFSQNPSSGSRFGNITINLTDEYKKNTTAAIEDLREDLARYTTFTARVYSPESGPPTGAPVQITFSGNNLESLEKSVEKVEKYLIDNPNTLDVTTSLKDDGSAFVLTVDKIKAAAVGLSPATIASALRTAVSGSTATTIKQPENDIDVVVKLNLNSDYTSVDQTNIISIDTIRELPIQTPNGTVLLGSVLSTTFEKNNAAIRHEDKERIASVSSYLKEGYTANEMRTVFENDKASFELPADVSVRFGGETEDVDQSFRDMFIALIAGMLLMFAILVLEFNSFRFTTYLLLIIPLSLIGVLAGLTLTRQTLSFPSMLGFIALAGVIINHAIILMDSMIVMMEAKVAPTLKEVVVEAASVRLRPIFLTTVTTVVGMIPLTTASALWAPLAFSIMFGLAFAMILTLVLVPILFYRWPGKRIKAMYAESEPPILLPAHENPKLLK